MLIMVVIILTWMVMVSWIRTFFMLAPVLLVEAVFLQTELVRQEDVTTKDCLDTVHLADMCRGRS